MCEIVVKNFRKSSFSCPTTKTVVKSIFTVSKTIFKFGLVGSLNVIRNSNGLTDMTKKNDFFKLKFEGLYLP